LEATEKRLNDVDLKKNEKYYLKVKIKIQSAQRSRTNKGTQHGQPTSLQFYDFFYFCFETKGPKPEKR